MLLKNFRGLIPIMGASNHTNNASFTKGFVTTANKQPVAGIDPPNFTTSLLTPSQTLYSATPSASTTNTCYFAVIFGDGDIPPTIDDYKLSGNFLDSTKLALTATSYPKMGIDSISFPVTMRNNTSETITIKEIGLAIAPRGATSTAGYIILLTRDVLPEPVNLEPQGVKSFEVAIDTKSFVTNAG